MKFAVSQLLRMNLINIINKNNSVNYIIDDISYIRFTLHMISIWMNDENRFDIKYNILNSIEANI